MKILRPLLSILALAMVAACDPFAAPKLDSNCWDESDVVVGRETGHETLDKRHDRKHD